MKKIILILTFAIILTGCEKKVLCSYTGEEDGYENKATITLTGSKKVKEVTGESSIDFKDEKLAKQYYEIMKSSEEFSGVSVKGSVITISLSSSDIKEMTSEDDDFTDYTMEEAQKELEKEGFTCK